MRVLARILGGLALFLATFLAIGFLLPGEWSTRESVTVEVPTDSVYDVLRRVESWPQWMPWPESGARFVGPASGPGAAFEWDDPVYGRGRFTIVEAVPSEGLTYRVAVEDGAMVIRGRIRLVELDGGDAAGSGPTTEIHWTEEASTGWNPLLALTLATVRDRQEEQLALTLAGLANHLDGPDGN